MYIRLIIALRLRWNRAVHKNNSLHEQLSFNVLVLAYAA